MKVYLLWYNDWEENTVLGVFETREQAKVWEEYFIMHPCDTAYCSMRDGNEIEDKNERANRLGIEEKELGKLDPEIKIDNLDLLETKYEKKNK